MEEFDLLPWHDALLLDVRVDRGAPGERDEVALTLEWPSGVRQNMVFADCYAFDAKMNFGVIAEESILGARCVSESTKLAEVKARWARSGVQLGDLACFEIETNSTASLLTVYARRFQLVDLPPK